ncbi:glucose 1-dehydrogenase [Conexibacter stalactiti]|uniref:Glucose 1-dehydrogenase n=1 Tax=Conexibacter stalactiti TaxID=1940611 RepID=A0ABU4HWS1_9ACTN|nr:glucose 1-dehydrogenase [Conexibacter stalactiti]MDW5597767.1 glucose 1-dehydrogenase [Conexibacter stalactiti]MEC5038409.1 glucose 1-dehydrogenase [Conexibacter stalactiti]
MNRFENKIALVTGGSSGIGRRTVERFVAEGATVITTGSSPASVERTRTELGDAVTVLPADALDLAAQRRLAATIAERFGALDVVVLNAGVSDWRPLEQWDEAGFDRVFDVNVKAPFFLLQALLPQLRRGAAVVVTASNSALGGFPGGSVYGASKAAISLMARSWAAELLTRGIRVNVVHPGPTDTPLFAKLGIPAEHREAAMRDVVAGVPIGRMGDPAEIAAAIAFLASDEAAFASGSELVVDGGVTRVHAAG